MSEKRGTKALEVWCKRVTEGYPGVKVENMTTSWRDGLAFCALIHHFRPDLIDFDSLDKRDVYRNNELAFRIAERHLGIPALLDAEDMVEYEVPDRLSMLTYLSQFYQTFVSQQGHSPNSRTPVKRSSVSPSLSSSPDLSPSMSPTSISPPTKVSARGVSVGASSRSVHDSCAHCGLPVFLAERLNVGVRRALYHRTCFRCARCSAQLTLANCYETEDGGFCCETCPDEEVDKCDSSSLGMDGVDLSDSKSGSICSAEASQNLTESKLSLSDDEKSADLQLERRCSTDEYSTAFESTVESFRRKPVPHESTVKAPLAITQQVTSDLGSKSDDLSQKTLLNTSVNSDFVESETAQPHVKSYESSPCQSTKEGTVPFKKVLTGSEGTLRSSEQPGNEVDQGAVCNVNSLCLESSDCNVNQPDNISTKPSKVSTCTKETKICSADDSVSSIVKMRRRMFEGEATSKSVETSPLSRKSSSVINKPEEKLKFEKDESCKSVDIKEAAVNQEGNITETSKIYSNTESVTKIEKISKDEASCERNSLEESKVHVTSATLRKSVEDKNLDDADNPQPISSGTVESKSFGSAADFKPTVSPRKVFPVPIRDAVTTKPEIVEDYPDELNPFGDEEMDDENFHDKKLTEKLKLVQVTETKKENTNPFGSSDEDEPITLRRKSAPEKPPRPPPPQSKLKGGSDYPTNSNRPVTVAVPPKVSPNPTQRRVIPASANLNPFWSDGEEPEEESSTPVPLPRTLRTTPEPSPRPRTTIVKSTKPTSSTGLFGSSSSLSSMTSNTGTNRRSKKPAPAPPSVSAESSLHSNLSLPPSPNPSMRSPHKRKSRPAPQPPKLESHPTALGEKPDKTTLDGRKMQKDEANRTVQAVGKEELSLPRDKSTFGQWKRKKGPAPPRPVPQRRQVRAMPLKELKQELDDIEVKQLELERQGVKLEQTIRHKFNTGPSLNDSSMTPDVENLVIQLFELVNEKNELFRKQAELMYLRRQQRLEEEHAELEYQIRCLMDQPERNKTDTIKAREEELIQRLVEVVERRNEIIECLEMDRLREAEEDQSIHSRLGLFAAKNLNDAVELSPTKNKKEKKKKKEKDSKKKKDSKVDADKDIDEVEAAAGVTTKEKKSKKKWFL